MTNTEIQFLSINEELCRQKDELEHLAEEQWRRQDIREGGAGLYAREARAKFLTTPPR